jgi:enoyl-CoA hydratase/carnithine racemase
MEEQKLRVTRCQDAVWITIDREHRRNAIDDATVLAISAALAQAEAEDARAVVLTGAGTRAFCAGADLAPGSGSFQYDFSRPGVPLVRLLAQARACPLPLIARVNGHVMAGGMGLLAMCDLAIAADHARFGLPEVRVGLFPMQVMAVLHRLVPARVLAEMALTGEPIDAAEAWRVGLVNHVVPGAELDAKVEWLLGRLRDKSPTGIRRGKVAMRQIEAMTLEQSLAFMEAQIGLLSMTEDATEGRAAFVEKRPPRFSGR